MAGELQDYTVDQAAGAIALTLGTWQPTLGYLAEQVSRGTDRYQARISYGILVVHVKRNTVAC